jgi:hypothetical protein
MSVIEKLFKFHNVVVLLLRGLAVEFRGLGSPGLRRLSGTLATPTMAPMSETIATNRPAAAATNSSSRHSRQLSPNSAKYRPQGVVCQLCIALYPADKGLGLRVNIFLWLTSHAFQSSGPSPFPSSGEICSIGDKIVEPKRTHRK